MIKGMGIDIIELKRIEKLMTQQVRFVQRILTDDEQKIWEALNAKRRIEYLAGRYAAKEALSKALGTGIGAQFGWHDVSILSAKNGSPTIRWNKERITSCNYHVSISHSETYAIAQVIIEEKKS